MFAKDQPFLLICTLGDVSRLLDPRSLYIQAKIALNCKDTVKDAGIVRSKFRA